MLVTLSAYIKVQILVWKKKKNIFFCSFKDCFWMLSFDSWAMLRVLSPGTGTGAHKYCVLFEETRWGATNQRKVHLNQE